MIKLIYKDPLIATFMARTHGVKFNKFGGLLDKVVASMDKAFLEKYGSGEALINFDIGVDQEGSCFYVHPDSYGIFEPREGDISNNGYKYDGGMNEWQLHIWNPAECEATNDTGSPYDNHTIQRNNTAFFMPMETDDE